MKWSEVFGDVARFVFRLFCKCSLRSIECICVVWLVNYLFTYFVHCYCSTIRCIYFTTSQSLHLQSLSSVHPTGVVLGGSAFLRQVTVPWSHSSSTRSDPEIEEKVTKYQDKSKKEGKKLLLHWFRDWSKGEKILCCHILNSIVQAKVLDNWNWICFIVQMCVAVAAFGEFLWSTSFFIGAKHKTLLWVKRTAKVISQFTKTELKVPQN